MLCIESVLFIFLHLKLSTYKRILNMVVLPEFLIFVIMSIFPQSYLKSAF